MVFEIWDIVLLAAVSLQVVVIAYVHHPKRKAFMITLPIPFTFSALAVGRPIDATNVSGLGMFLLFIHAVRLLYTKARLPIVLAIAIPAIAYCLLGVLLAGIIPPTDLAFWIGITMVLILAAVGRLAVPPREEPGRRSPMPIYYKVPMTMALIFFIILIKKHLLGFMTTFPLVGVFASYETRKSLWTTCREVPIVLFMLGAVLIIIRLTQAPLSLGPALIISWAAMMIYFIPRFIYLFML